MVTERSIEVKVGALILLSFGILGAFVLILGGLTFQSTYPLYVDFDNPGGLQTGAPVRIAGVKAGKVDALEFRGGTIDPQTGRRTLVRAKLAVEQTFRNAVHEDALFYVTTQGVLGEQFLSIDLQNNRQLISDIAVNTAGLLKNLNGVLVDNRERINRTMSNVEQLSSEARTLTVQARAQYVDNPKIQHTIENIDRLTGDLQRDSGPLLKDAREAAANLNRVSATLGSPEQQAKLQKAIDEISQLAGRANATAADAQSIVAHIKKGEGTVGSLVMDEQVYDDVQEMVRDLKHNPWKFLWKQ